MEWRQRSDLCSKVAMQRSLSVVLVAVALASCRTYDLESRLSDQAGVVPPDQFARYGREQAQQIAIAREFGRAYGGSSPEKLQKQADAAITYARTLPDVIDTRADPLGYRLAIRFRSGWLTMVTPIDDGKRGAETPGLPAVAEAATNR
jgi:hypothetical protein